MKPHGDDDAGRTKVGVIGCGWAFDLYMATWRAHPELELAGVADVDPARLQAVCRHYDLRGYPDNEALLRDESIDIVVNLTPIPAHRDVTMAALRSGKHVYSEKPLATTLADARELLQVAKAEGLHLSCAPCNVLGDTAQTMWKAIDDGAVGDAQLVYAELDTGATYLMQPSRWRSASGAPWPWRSEFAAGCTWEHAGYHLSWMCAMFGPVRSVTAFSKLTIPDKSPVPLTPADAPDFSVACLDFHSGVTARLTCAIAGSHDLSLRVVGNEGTLVADTYANYRTPVRLVRHDAVTLGAESLRSVRNSNFLQRCFGLHGRAITLVGRAVKGSWLERLKRREQGYQDKCAGIAELADAIRTGRSPFPGPDFIMHVTELTLAIQSAGVESRTHTLESTFQPLALPERTRQDAASDWRRTPAGAPLAGRLLWAVWWRAKQRLR